MERRIDKLDLISSLPEPLLHHIMSFLPFEEAVQTSILSKGWKQAWDTYPSLEFTDVCYNISRKKETLRYMEQMLLKRCREKISLKKFSFRMELSNYPELASYIDRSLSYAVGCNVKELKLEIVYWGSVWWFKLPQSVLCVRSITVLELGGCKLEFGGSSMKLPSLRRLLLKQVKAEDRVIDNLVARCPLIEYLRIDECEGFKSLELFTLSRVDKIKVCNNYELERLDVNAVNVHSVSIVGSTSCEINIAPCKSLKRLKLDMVSIRDDRFYYQISELPLLEYLSISRLETPNLNTFEYVGNIVTFTSIDISLSKADLYFCSESMDSDWFIAYIDLLAKFHQFSRVLTLQSYFGETAIVPAEVREILRSPLPGIGHLKFIVHEEDVDFPIAEIVDGLLWISSHLETLSLEYKSHYCDKFSFQDCIKKVEVEHIISKKNKVKRYSFEDEEIWENINGLCRYKK
ncbi:F-box domain containing protein [Melia azedarach]|uniref:F-box domain containing protein n=1 Tax=Melia azedarach TaxID=155640 RepID=A0ACC1X4V9_MELAZ|nr:F-box domain containing protein [Melia azedarach]